MTPISMAQYIFQGKHYITATKDYSVCAEAAHVAISPPYDLGASAGLLEMKAHKMTGEKLTARSSLHTYWH